MKAIVFDTETTGLTKPSGVPLSQQPKIIEFGARKVNLETGDIEDLNQLINPQEPLEEIITKITGLTDEDLKDAPVFGDFLPTAEEFFKDGDFLIAHNAQFDQSLLTFELQRLNYVTFPWPRHIICTVQEYRPRYGKYMKMEALYEDIMGQPLKQTHRALDDVIALYDLLMKDDFFMGLTG